MTAERSTSSGRHDGKSELTNQRSAPVPGRSNIQLQKSSASTVQSFTQSGRFISTFGFGPHPMPQHAVVRRVRPKSHARNDQLPATQQIHRGLRGAFGEAGCLGDIAQAGIDGPPFRARRGRVKVQIHQKRRRLFVVANEVPQQNIEHVSVHRHGPGAARTIHKRIMHYTFNRTRLSRFSPPFASTPRLPRRRIFAP